MTFLHMLYGAGAFWFLDRLHQLRKNRKHSQRMEIVHGYPRSTPLRVWRELYDQDADR